MVFDIFLVQVHIVISFLKAFVGAIYLPRRNPGFGESALREIRSVIRPD